MLETARLVLRRPERRHATLLATVLADPEVTAYLAPGARIPPDPDRLYQAWQHAWVVDGYGQFAVQRRQDHAVLGRVGLLAWDPATWSPGTAAAIGPRAEVEIGWLLRRSAWGQGYATEAAIAVRDWVHGSVGVGRLISLIHPANTRSLRVAAKLGQHHERTVTTASGVTAALWSTSFGTATTQPPAT
jgi:RimJ/RimL family protein N-acetyltransferase